MFTYLKRLQSERDSLTQTATSLTNKAAEEDRDLTQTEKDSLGTMQTRCAEIDSQLTTYGEQLDNTRKYAALRDRLGGDEGAPGDEDKLQRRSLDNRGAPGAQDARWGAVFIESAQFRSYEGHGSSGRVDVPLNLETRAPIDLASLFNTAPPFLFVPPTPAVTTPLIGAVSTVPTSGNSVTVLTMPAPPPLAAVVPEGTAKPEAAFEPTEVPLALHTLAHYRPITRQALEDIPQIQSIVENQLRGGIALKIDAEITAALAAATLASAGATVDLSNIRIGLGAVQAAGWSNANTVLLNPTDWAALDIAVMQATSNGPQSAANFWGLRPIASSGVPAGTAYVGDFKTAVSLFTRGNASVYLTDSHADYFVKNILVVLAEARAVAAVTESSALVKIGTGVVTGGASASASGK